MKRKFILLLALVMIVTMIPEKQLFAMKSAQKIEVYSYDDDYDMDEDYNLDEDYDMDEDYNLDEDYDDIYEDEEEIVLYKNIIKSYPNVKLSSKSLDGKYSGMDRGDTLVYNFTIAKKTNVVLRFSDNTYGALSYAIFNNSGEKEVEKSAEFSFSAKKYVHTLGAGTHVLKVCAREDLTDIDFTLFLADTTITKTLKGYQTYKASPGLGTGTWKTSNKKVVKLSKTSGSATTFTPLKPGKATVTFKNSDGSVTYKVTVKKTSKTINKTLTSCDIFVANPEQGKGNWKVGNQKVAIVSRKSGSKVTIRAKNKGTTTVTFANALATYRYKIKVKTGSSYPVDRAYFEMDSAYGIKPSVLISNNSDKTIKYVRFRVYFYNQVNDPVYWYDNNYADLEVIGPLKPWKFQWYDWDPVFYNNAVYKMRIKTATVIYTDGTEKTVKVNKSYFAE